MQSITYIHTTQPIPLKRKCKVDLGAVILESAASGAVTKSKIYYNTFLTYSRLKGYLSLLLENGLIDYLEKERLYMTTEKGVRFLQAYNCIREIVG
jgi:predicted transcriptional regulator